MNASSVSRGRVPAVAFVAALFAALVAVLVAGCGTTSTGTTSTTSAPQTSATILDTAPATEATGLESPQHQQNGGPSISVASLPIGGVAVPDADDATQQCADVNWVGPSPIPDDVAIQVTGLSLDPSDIFAFGGTSCGSNAACSTSVRWSSTSPTLECSVPLTRIAASDDPVTLIVSGTVSCATRSACDEFRTQLDSDQFSGAHVELDGGSGSPDSGGPPSDSAGPSSAPVQSPDGS